MNKLLTHFHSQIHSASHRKKRRADKPEERSFPRLQHRPKPPIGQEWASRRRDSKPDRTLTPTQPRILQTGYASLFRKGLVVFNSCSIDAVQQLQLHVHQTRKGRVPVDLLSECHKSTFIIRLYQVQFFLHFDCPKLQELLHISIRFYILDQQRERPTGDSESSRPVGS